MTFVLAHARPRREYSASAFVHQPRAHGLMGPEVIDALDRQQLREPSARTIDATLDRPDRAAADLRRLLVREARCPHQNQGLALIRRKLRKRAGAFLELQPAGLLGLRLQG